jgi:predicted dehydrogenase
MVSNAVRLRRRTRVQCLQVPRTAQWRDHCVRPTPAPWWDLNAGESEHFPRQDADAYFLSGTEASMTLPRLEIWEYRRGRGWHDPLTVERTALHKACPYTEQWRHFRALIEGREPPVCSTLDGLRTLEATLAVHTAAEPRPVAER